jgi:hypothetical protein
MNPLIQCKTTILPLLITAVLACFVLLPKVEAVVPAPDGGYPGFNTAEGQKALFSLTTGVANTAIGWYSLFSNTDGSYNTAVGAGTLLFNAGDQTTGDGTQNTAIGTAALLFNTTGSANTATGVTALSNNSTGIENTADGSQALFSNTTGSENTANGAFALYRNTTGHDNAANGQAALVNNETGADNTASGVTALRNNTTGNNNIGVGSIAGFNLTTGDNNIDIGNEGVAAEANTIRIGTVGVQTATYIAGISGAVVPGGVTVIVDAGGQLGTVVSSQRFKDGIKAMDKASEAILALKPVTFRYKKEIDPKSIPQFGLVAEDVEKVNPDLVARDDQGKVYTVRYEAVNAMLLNEFLKEHRKVEQLKKDFESRLAEQQTQIEALTAGLRKVSAEIEMNGHASQAVAER